jgi:hypothetical protein
LSGALSGGVIAQGGPHRVQRSQELAGSGSRHLAIRGFQLRVREEEFAKVYQEFFPAPERRGHRQAPVHKASLRPGCIPAPAEGGTKRSFARPDEADNRGVGPMHGWDKDFGRFRAQGQVFPVPDQGRFKGLTDS